MMLMRFGSHPIQKVKKDTNMPLVELQMAEKTRTDISESYQKA